MYGMSLKECVERFPGIRRLHDIPGRMIPALYFMYERDGDVSVLDQVFRHNRLDILDMVVCCGICIACSPKVMNGAMTPVLWRG